MNNKIYLVRNGQPEYPSDQNVYSGQTDLPLSVVGRLQAVLLGEYFRDKEISVYHTGLLCPLETASYIRPKTAFKHGFPEPANGVSDRMVYARNILDSIAVDTKTDIVIVADTDMIRLLLHAAQNASAYDISECKHSYGSISTLFLSNQQYAIQQIGFLPHPQLNAAVCRELFSAYKTPEHVWNHCAATADKALQLAKGSPVDMDLLYAAALLHDIAKGEKDHASAGAQLLTRLGYPEIGDIIAVHHDLPVSDELSINEKTILYLADKLVQRNRVVTLQERFSASQTKCTDEVARRNHAQRFSQALQLQTLLTDNASQARPIY